ncbi:MAG: hypothetical protein GX552_14465 [Chloroflexi bacterium]|nr:hypothetical protein [Chloroflexota bacterium]
MNKSTSPTNRNWLLILIGVAALLLVVLILALTPAFSPLDYVLRGAALLGYLAVFLAIISSAFVRELTRFFGRSFIKTHHYVAVSGLILITIHPIAAALRESNLGVFIPDVSSPLGFLAGGGRVAWYLIGIAALAALLRATWRKSWRQIHWLVYLGFLLATIHANLLGTDVGTSTLLRVISILMALAVVAVLVWKRLPKRKK